MSHLRLAVLLPLAAALAACSSDSNSPPPAAPSTPVAVDPAQSVSIRLAGRYNTGLYSVGAAEIVAFDPTSRRLLSVNARAGRVDVLNIGNPAQPVRERQLDAVADAIAAGQTQIGAGGVNAVACAAGRCAVAVEAFEDQLPGAVVVYRTSDFTRVGVYRVGVLPDSIAMSSDGRYIVTADEAEPRPDYLGDPEGSISVIDLGPGFANAVVSVLDFRDFNVGGARAAEFPSALRIYGRGAGNVSNRAQDLEPEYAAITPDNQRAVVSLQENNGLAIVTLNPPRIERLVALGTKDHSIAANGLDPSDRDNAARIGAWPVRGMYQPDAIAPFFFNGELLVATANEGDARDYAAFAEEARVGSLTLDPTRFPNAATLRDNANLGRLTVSTAAGADSDGDGDIDVLNVLGARSFSIFRTDGSLLFDSGNQFETITRDRLGATVFNSDNAANNSFDTRSDNKGPEPEAIVVGEVGGGRFAFVGLERIGGVMVYNLNNPAAPTFVDYVNDRNFGVNATIPDANGDGQPDTNPAVGDLGPEAVAFIPAAQAPGGQALVVVGSEISGTVSIYTVTPR
jgi:hypothetical protein